MKTKKQNTFKTDPIDEKLMMKSVIITCLGFVAIGLFIIVLFYLAIILGK